GRFGLQVPGCPGPRAGARTRESAGPEPAATGAALAGAELRAPPHTLLRRCRHVCRGWRALVDRQALWLLILARDHGATGRTLLPLVRSCLPPARDGRLCPLGRFCLRRPIGRNFIWNRGGQEGFRKWMVRQGGNGWVLEEHVPTVPGTPSQSFGTSFRWCLKKEFLDLEEEGLWPELLDSGKIEICVSEWQRAQDSSACVYRLLVQLLDANQTVLDTFSAVPDPSQQWNNNSCLWVTHVFSNLKMGVRLVSFEHWGEETRFWAGDYEARVTNSSVIARVHPS
ncbi:F-box only protein 27, partial [Daubentonia madagascariensis]